MSAQVTEAHIARARASGYTTDNGVQMAAQFIANNEAAKAERDQLRAEVEAITDTSVKLLASLTAERAEVERLEAKISNQADRIRYLEGATNHATGTPLSQAIARAELAETELATEREKVRVLQEAMKFSANKDKYFQAQFDPCQRASAALAATEGTK